MPLLRVVPWAMWGALAIFSVATYSSLPSEIAQHFNAAGEVTSTTPKSLLSWLMVPGIALLTMAGLSWLSSLLERQPGLFNFPEKERFLKIPRGISWPGDRAHARDARRDEHLRRAGVLRRAAHDLACGPRGLG